MTRRARVLARLSPALLALLLATACAGDGEPMHPALAPPTDADRARFARRRLEDARVFRRQGRLDAAERALRRALEAAPEDARAHRTLAEVLEAQGNAAAAAEHRARADALAPPPPPPPVEPADLPTRRLRVALVPPRSDDAAGGRVPEWPQGIAAPTLERRLAVRLPGARVSQRDPASVAEARRWLEAGDARAAISLRVERAYCDESIKDGRFAVARLRVAAQARGAAGAAVGEVGETLLDPRGPGPCPAEALARALERALAEPALREALTRRAGGGWSTAAIRDLFPGLGERIEDELGHGLVQLRAGAVAEAAATFARAARVDPEDPVVRAYQREAAETLAMMGELGARGARRPQVGSPAPRTSVDPRLSPERRAAIEAQLEDERRRRDDLLAALAVLDEDVAAPPPEVLTRLSAVPIAEPQAFGPSQARERAGGPVEARAVYAPDGGLLARYYLPAGAELPVLREEDLDGDGRGDRWIGYAGGTRQEVWEDAGGEGRPDVHLVFELGGAPLALARIELDRDRDGRPERVFRYGEGRLQSEARDGDGDGVLDCFERFDAMGSVAEREEDLDGDGRVDRRSRFEDGHLVVRELRDASLAVDAEGGCVTPASRTPR